MKSVSLSIADATRVEHTPQADFVAEFLAELHEAKLGLRQLHYHRVEHETMAADLIHRAGIVLQKLEIAYNRLASPGFRDGSK